MLALSEKFSYWGIALSLVSLLALTTGVKAASSPFVEFEAAVGRYELLTSHPGRTLASSTLPCTKTFVDGRVVKARSCNDCCGLEEYEADSANCVSSCTCEFTEERHSTRTVVDAVYPTLIRGVPVLFQYDTKPKRTKKYPIGCGPVALSSLFLWYHSLGWTGLADDYENGSGEIAWDIMVEDMADYLDTWVRKNASPTLMKKVQPGMEDFLSDSGYSANITHLEVTDDSDETDDAFEQIKSSVQQGRPIILGYDINESAGGGIGGGGDDFGFIDHYGVIVGYDDTVSPAQIYVNTGWGADSTGNDDGNTYDWVIGAGKVHLWFVQLRAGEKDVGSEVCATENWDTVYDPLSLADPKHSETDYFGVMFKHSSYNSYPVQNRVIRGAECGVIGGEETHEEDYIYTYEWSEELSCQGKDETYDDVIDGSWEAEERDIDDMNDPEKPLP